MELFGDGNGTPLQYSCLENPMDGGVWKAAVQGVAEGWTRLSDLAPQHSSNQCCAAITTIHFQKFCSSQIETLLKIFTSNF